MAPTLRSIGNRPSLELVAGRGDVSDSLPRAHDDIVPVFVVTGETLGRGDDALGRRLMTKFLKVVCV